MVVMSRETAWPSEGRLRRVFVMHLELWQLARPYGRLRIENKSRRARLLESMLAHGQQVPVVVVAEGGAARPDRYVLIDGYLRVEVLEDLHRDEVEAQEWQMSEAHALALAHRLDSTRRRSALEEGWLLHTLSRDHDMKLGQISILLGRSRSWVSRRLGLVTALPTSAQAAVQRGQVCAQAAQRYLVPLARANSKHCETLIAALDREAVSVRQMHTLYVGWRGGDAEAQQRIVSSPLLYLAAYDATQDDDAADPAGDELVRDLNIIASVARRAERRIDEGALSGADTSGRKRRVKSRWQVASRALEGLGARLEELDVGHGNSNSNPAAIEGGPRDSHDRAHAGNLAQRGKECIEKRPPGGTEAPS